MCWAALVSLLTIAPDANAPLIRGPGGASSCSGHPEEATLGAQPPAASSRKEARPLLSGALSVGSQPLCGVPRDPRTRSGVFSLLEDRLDSRRVVPGAPHPPALPPALRKAHVSQRQACCQVWAPWCQCSSPQVPGTLTSEAFRRSGVIPRLRGRLPSEVPPSTPLLSFVGGGQGHGQCSAGSEPGVLDAPPHLEPRWAGALSPCAARRTTEGHRAHGEGAADLGQGTPALGQLPPRWGPAFTASGGPTGQAVQSVTTCEPLDSPAQGQGDLSPVCVC